MERPATARLFRFGLFEADLENARLARNGVRIRLQEQPFRILALLLERAGQVVTREELRQELWPSGTYVDFDGSLNAALKRLRAALDDDADNPRFVETVPKRGYRFIAPVAVETAPLEAPAGKTDLLVPPAADTQPASANGNEVPSGRWNGRRLILIGACVAVVAIAAFFALPRKAVAPRPQAARDTVTKAPLHPSIAVLGFQNASGQRNDAWLSTALAEMLRTELGAGSRLRVIPGEDVEQFRLGAPWSGEDSLSPQTTSRIGKALGSDLLVLGSYATLGEGQSRSIRVDFRLQKAQTGEILYEGAETATARQFFALVAKVGVALREKLGLPVVTESEEVGVLSSLPANADADQFYSLGLAKMREDDVVTAKDLFLQAEKITPDFPLVHLMLSRAWASLGYDQTSRTEARKAFDLSASLPQTDKLQVEGAYYETLKDWDKAADAYRALHALYPESVDYAERLIIVLNSAGRREEALDVVKGLRQLPPPASDDPRVDFWQAKLISYTNGPAARPYIERAVAEARARGQKLLYAHFRVEQCLGSLYSNTPQVAKAYCQEAYQIFLAAGNQLMVADTLRIMGDQNGSEGNIEGAVELYTQALAILRQLGEHEKTGAVLNNMAVAVENQGQIDRSEKLYEEAKQNFEECGDTLNVAVTLGNIAEILLERGNLRGAVKQYRDALQILQSVDPAGVAFDLSGIAQVRLLEGDLAEAGRFAGQALTAAQARGAPEDTAASFSLLGDISMAHGDLSGARQQYQQALQIRQTLKHENSIAESQAALAAVSIEEGKAPEAEHALRESLVKFQKEHATMDEIRAETDLSRSLLGQGKLADARKAISAAIALSRASDDPSLKLPVAIQDARVEAAELESSPNPKPALAEPRRKLQQAILAARRLGYYGIECDARLALGELEMRLTPAAGRSHLRDLANQAHQRGLDLVARKAGEFQASAVARSGQGAVH
jgi:DNA-binding winged helix-turn-helix (wHTH) protein/tetratricopeptide (TPR) repeat protein/TolB-like protein